MAIFRKWGYVLKGHFEEMGAWLQILLIVGHSTLFYLIFDTYSGPGSVSSYGIPIGGELEYVDGNTIARAIQGRTEINVD